LALASVTGAISQSKLPSSLAALGALGRGDGVLVHGLAAEGVLADALFGKHAHGLAALVGVLQPVDGHVVVHGGLAVLHALARKHQVRGVAHALHAAGHHHVGAAGAQHVVREHHGAHARAAHLGEGDGTGRVGQTGLAQCLTRRRLALAGHQAVAHQHLVDGVSGQAGALHGGTDGNGAEFPAGEVGEVTQQAADGRAGWRRR
jgi:hypothetical protein